MEFGEKIKRLRKAENLTQSELGEKVGISVRSIYKYESEHVIPRQKSIYQRFAGFFNVPVEFLKEDKNSDFEFITTHLYGDYGKRESQRIIEDVRGLFAGGKITEQDRDGLMKTLQEIYWETKEIQKEKLNKSEV